MHGQQVDEQQTEDLLSKVHVFGARLSGLANKLVQKRATIEQRWLEDLRQYEGVYSRQEESNMKASGGSQVFVNVTRAKVHAAEARLSDMMFPTDDRNFSIDATVVPKIAKHQNNQEQAAQDSQGQSITVGQVAQDVISKAKEAAKGMQDEVDDQLMESGWASVCRDVIHDACLVGTGIIKGPVVVGKTRKAWQQQETEHVLTVVEDVRASVERVDYWDFFPDMDGRRLNECEFIMQRHRLGNRELFELNNRPGFIKSQILDLLKAGPNRSTQLDSQISQQRAISGGNTDIDSNRFEVWEYHGAVAREELEACGCDLEEGAEYTLEAIVWFSGTFVLKATVNPLDSGDRPFSVFSWIEDETSVFGKGIPHQVRSQQRVCNASWRMVMDDAAASIGSQIVFDDEMIEPEDGNRALTGRKLWCKTDPTKDVRQAFAVFDIPSHQAELMAIYNSARQMIDDETGMPTIAEGDQVGAQAQTMGGMAMVMNASLVVLRRAVKNFDDSIIVPTIRRFYDWNMQFSQNQEIKGDFSVDARGSSALLTKELQSQSLMNLMQFAGHPVFGPMTKAGDLYRKTVQALQISPNDIVKTDEEIEQMQQQQSEQGTADPDMAKTQMQMQMQKEKLQAEYQMHQERMQMQQNESQFRLQERELEREIAIAKLSADQNIAIERINADLVKTRENNTAKKQLQKAEIYTKARFGSGL